MPASVATEIATGGESTDMGMRLGRCWFAECHAAGTMVDLDGSHPRSLCATHANGITEALKLPGTYRVSWGSSKADRLATLESELAGRRKVQEEARAALDAYPLDSEFGEDDEYRRLEQAELHAEIEVDLTRERIGEVARRTWDHPMVRVDVATD